MRENRFRRRLRQFHRIWYMLLSVFAVWPDHTVWREGRWVVWRRLPRLVDGGFARDTDTGSMAGTIARRVRYSLIVGAHAV